MSGAESRCGATESDRYTGQPAPVRGKTTPSIAERRNPLRRSSATSSGKATGEIAGQRISPKISAIRSGEDSEGCGGHIDGSHVDGSHDDSSHVDGSHDDSGHVDGSHDDSGHVDGSHDDSGHVDGSHDDSGHVDGSNDDGGEAIEEAAGQRSSPRRPVAVADEPATATVAPRADSGGFAWGPVALIAGVTTVVLLTRSARYDYFGDELYFLAAGRHLGAGYADQGPLVPLLARSAAALAPGSLVALRLPSIIAAVAGVVLAAATAREFGGGRRAQWLAAAAYATGPYLITQAASLSTFALDSTAGAAVIWLLVRWTRVRRDHLLLVAGAVIAIDVQVKLLILVLGAGLAAAALLTGPRDLLRRSAFWAGATIVVVATVPGIRWQRQHGWPQSAMGAIIRDEQRAATGGVAGLPVQWVILAGLLGGLLALPGLWVLLWRSDFRPYRFAGIATLLQALFVVAVGGRPYYVTACFPALFAAGAVTVATLWPRTTPSAEAPSPLPTMRKTRLPAMRKTLRIAGVAVIAISVAISATVTVALPQPISRLHRPTGTQAELSARMRTFGTTGWTALVDAVDRAYAELPAADRADAVVVAQTYWQAAAIDMLGTRPPVFSPNRGYAYFGAPPLNTRTVLYVTAGDTPAPDAVFEAARPVTRLNDPLGFPGIDRGITVWRCDRPRRPWPVLWRELSTLVLDPGLRSAPNSPASEGYPS
ncbi:glycosyltransferase family 39 protein [Nocardia aurantia]|uniref:Glycosyltransferase RgtA/B/C/D-like domain-containing protein n=1 Tax=Nocardia aurantia TaxID=2585199 RepID=A0A7K0DVK5_9NOCA|nr:glycosyltransferase family 39 protein [Nocardia aurantia]MQY29813.1 hypothetical protein [Nocardia aurantia]